MVTIAQIKTELSRARSFNRASETQLGKVIALVAQYEVENAAPPLGITVDTNLKPESQ